MDFEGNFRFWGSFDVSRLKETVLSLPEEAWSDEVAKSSSVHYQSRGIFLRNDFKPEPLYGTIHPHPPQLDEPLAPILEAILGRVEAGYLIRLQFSRHTAGHGFAAHTDRFSYTLVHSYRMHLPITTNPGVWFEVGGERRHMGEGEAWEINNTRTHAGANDGVSPRIHLIVDLARPLYTVTERLRALMNLEAIGGRAGALVARPQLEGEAAPSGVTIRSVHGPRAAGRVDEDLLVAFRYRLVDAETGDLLSGDASREPAAVVHGRRQLPPALDSVLHGLRVGDTFDATFPAEAAYGAYDEGLVFELPPAKVPPDLVPAKDDIATVIVGGRAPFVYSTTLFDDDTLVVDANHRFSGKRVRFQGEVAAIRALDPAEYRYAVYEGPTLPSGDRLREAVEGFRAGPAAYPCYTASPTVPAQR